MDKSCCDDDTRAEVSGEEVDIDIDSDPADTSSYDWKEGCGRRDDEDDE